MTFPHPDWAISSSQQTIALVVFGLGAVVSLIYCSATARRLNSPWPLFVFLGAALTLSYEPFADLLGHCAYPVIGVHSAVDFVGQQIPLYMLLVYMFYLGPVVWLMQRFEAGITMRQLGTYFGVGVVLCSAFETYPVSKYWWHYTGDQPLAWTGLPMWYWFVNPMSIFGIAAILHLLRQHVLKRDLETAAFVVLTPMALFATHGSASVPLYVGLSSHSTTWAVVGSFGSMAIALLYMWLIGCGLTVPALTAEERTARVNDAPATGLSSGATSRGAVVAAGTSAR